MSSAEVDVAPVSDAGTFGRCENASSQQKHRASAKAAAYAPEPHAGDPSVSKLNPTEWGTTHYTPATSNCTLCTCQHTFRSTKRDALTPIHHRRPPQTRSGSCSARSPSPNSLTPESSPVHLARWGGCRTGTQVSPACSPVRCAAPSGSRSSR